MRRRLASSENPASPVNKPSLSSKGERGAAEEPRVQPAAPKNSHFYPSFCLKSAAIACPWNLPFSIKISFVRDPATITPAT